MGEFNLKSLRLEGHLLKYTNVVKGFQNRYFVVNIISSKLDYYMSEDGKHNRPRGSIELLNSIINPSEEDSNTFTINTPENEIFKLRAQDAKERQQWVNVLRYVAQSMNENDLKIYINEKNESETNNANINLKDESLIVDKKEDEEIINQYKLNFKTSNKEMLKEIFNQVKSSHQKLEKSINELPVRQAQICKYDKDILILKATANSCVNNIIDCCNLLCTNQKYKNQNEVIEALTKNTSKVELRKSQHKSDTSSVTSNRKSIIDHEEELTDQDDDTINMVEMNSDYEKQFEKNKHLILQLLPNLKQGMDLTKTTLPTFLLEKRSLLEMLADSFSHSDLFIKISDEKTSEDRFMSVLEWYLSSFNQIIKVSLAKKPYNPVLGEVFNCSWKVNEDKQTHLVTYVAEQVSHHPPVTLFYVECKSKKMKLNASLLTRTKYLGMSISVQMIGELILILEKYNEEYHITLPNCYTRSIVTNPWIELGDKCTLTCTQSELKANIEFQVKSFYGEKSNQVYAEVFNVNDELLCKVKGEWNGKLDYEFMNGKTNKQIDLASLKVNKKRVRPIDIQEENESRRIWYHVSEALKNSDINSANNYKSIIEKQQRVSEKLRREKNLDYVSKNFFKTRSLTMSRSILDVDLNDEYKELINWVHKNWTL